MPLQPPNPDFLAQAPKPVDRSANRPSGWIPAGLTGMLLVILAMVFGVPELLN
jgi:hypothetical protein